MLSSSHQVLDTYLSFFLLFWLCHAACGILAPQPGTEPRPTAVKVKSPNHWTARKFPLSPSIHECIDSLRQPCEVCAFTLAISRVKGEKFSTVTKITQPLSDRARLELQRSSSSIYALNWTVQPLTYTVV